ncbi:hypothetical protein PG997_003321 [Apiospora hydei]|uniref:Uncharacterized protein n=1 Tax=Apiospora hydei TaxID=1337664 RepID=A0ABR1WYZ6_9PEZI
MANDAHDQSRGPEPGLEVVQSEHSNASSPQVVHRRSGESAPEVALPDHAWIYPVHDANEQQKVLPSGLLQQQIHQRSARGQQYSHDYNAKYPSLRGNHFLTTPEVVPNSAAGSFSAGSEEDGGYQSPLKEASLHSPPRKRPRRQIIILVVVVAVILVGSTVGGVVGALRSHSR